MSDTPLTSYAQNGEDITLSQGFRQQITGFYVDIGAAVPLSIAAVKRVALNHL